MASELAYVPLPFASAYSVAKRGMTAYADALRVEYGSHLHVSTVYPGYVRTPIHAAAAEFGLALEGQVRREEVDDVVATVLRVLAARRPPRDTACTRAGKWSCGRPGTSRPWWPPASAAGWPAAPSPGDSTPHRWPPAWSAG